MEYDKEFEAWYKTALVFRETWKDDAHEEMHAAWQAARKDHYRIGEEVESIDTTRKAKICAVVDFIGLNALGAYNVRRIPAKSSIDEIAEDGLNSLYETFEKLAYALQQTSNVLKKAVEDGTNRAIKELEAER